MNNRPFVLAAPVLLVLAGAAFHLTRKDSGTQAHAGTSAPAPGAGASDERPAGLANAALAAWQAELLELAFETASSIPPMPHIKTRSREQERVIGACFELDQPRRAQAFIERVDNWRRGIGYADLAFYCAQRGAEQEALHNLELARKLAERMRLESEAEEAGFDGDDQAIESFQAWRRDRIRARIARTYLQLGQPEKAIEFEDGLEASESGVVEVMRARTIDAGAARELLAALDSVAASSELERVRTAMEIGVVLLERFYDQEDERASIREKLASCLEKAPAMLQVDVLLTIAGTALERSDPGTALELVGEAEQVLARSPLAIEDELPLRARLAERRYRAGEQEKGRQAADQALARFRAARAEIESLLRADVLLPIAEAYVAIGERGTALEVYRLAAVDGAENPNARVRAEDLVELCCSLATNGIEPDGALLREIRRTRAGLGEPW